MKTLIILFLLCLQCVSSYAQERSIHNNDDRIEFLVAKKEKITEAEKKELAVFALDIQNRGQILDESKHDHKGSLDLINKAITLFIFLDDSLGVANNRKFKGYLLGRLGRFDDAKVEIAKAINIYQLKNKLYGVAVSQFDLSRVYDFENKLDSAIYYCRLSSNFWKSKAVASRIFNNQSMLIHLLSKSNQLDEAKLIQKESRKMAGDSTLHWQDLIDYYFVSEELFKNVTEPGISKQYNDLYIKKIAELRQEGIIAKSYFDNSPK